MTTRPANGKSLFYHRDSEGNSELASRQYVEWAVDQSRRLDVSFSGNPDVISTMIAEGQTVCGDLYLDFGISGNIMSRPGLDAFIDRAMSDLSVSHLFIPRRDRLARPDDPTDALSIENKLRRHGLTIVFMEKTLAPLYRGQRQDLGELLTSNVDYHTAGKFRRDLAERLIYAKLELARLGCSIGGEAPYGFERWLCSVDGKLVRKLQFHEIVKLPGHHVFWLPTAEDKLDIVRRILELIETMPATRIARLLNHEGVPAPMAGRFRTTNELKVQISGLWTQNTVKAIASNRILVAICDYGKRAMGDQMRLTPKGPRELLPSDYRADGKPKVVLNGVNDMISVPAKFEPVIPSERSDRIRAVLEHRGRHLKGKTRAKGDNPNPLSGHIFDMNCGWPMFRYQRRGRWCQTCALYQNTEAKVCDHNVVDGAETTQFAWLCLRQKLLHPQATAKLRSRLEQMAATDVATKKNEKEAARLRAESAEIKRQLATIERNMALAPTPEERQSTAKIFHEERAKQAAIERALKQAMKVNSNVSSETEVQGALELLSKLTRCGDVGPLDYKTIGEQFIRTNMRLFLRFRKFSIGRREVNIPAGGVLTLGSAPPPIPLYDGPTDRVAIRQKLAKGESVSPVLQHGAVGTSNVGKEGDWSANVQRGTTRCT